MRRRNADGAVRQSWRDVVLTGKVLGRPAASDVRSYAVKVERIDVLVELE